MSALVKVLAKIELFSGEKTRTTPIYSGYRPICEISGLNTRTSGQIDLLNRASMEPGATDIVQITFLKHIVKDTIRVDTLFTFGEGLGDLGKGIILELL